MENQSLEAKIIEARQRTIQWTRGIDVSFPAESCLPEIKKPVIIDWGSNLSDEELKVFKERNPECSVISSVRHSEKGKRG